MVLVQGSHPLVELHPAHDNLRFRIKKKNSRTEGETCCHLAHCGIFEAATSSSLTVWSPGPASGARQAGGNDGKWTGRTAGVAHTRLANFACYISRSATAMLLVENMTPPVKLHLAVLLSTLYFLLWNYRTRDSVRSCMYLSSNSSKPPTDQMSE